MHELNALLALRINQTLYETWYVQPPEEKKKGFIEKIVDALIDSYGNKIETAIHELRDKGIEVGNGQTIDTFLVEVTQIIMNAKKYTILPAPLAFIGAPFTPFDLAHLATYALFAYDTIRYAFTDMNMLKVHINPITWSMIFVGGSAGYIIAAPLALKKINPDVAKVQRYMISSLIYRHEEKMFNQIDRIFKTELSGRLDDKKTQKAVELFIPTHPDDAKFSTRTNIDPTQIYAMGFIQR